jgi:NAD-dependent dihydropyrimidine dehydrogenase PreA subunit
MVHGHALIDMDECIECGSCETECQEGAIVDVD